MTKVRIDVGDRVYWRSGEWVVILRNGELLTLQPLLGGPCEAGVSIFCVAKVVALPAPRGTAA